MILRILAGLIASILLLSAISRLVMVFTSSRSIFPLEYSPSARVAIVFGAGLRRDGSPTAVLRDRVMTAAALYRSGKIEKVLMSGDNRFIDYNEPAAMREYALSLGIPEKDIVLDYAGRRTYDTCVRAQKIFQLTDVILITQPFHLPRALYTCKALGLNAWGVAAINIPYRKSSQLFWNIREIPSSLLAMMDVHLLRPDPVLGEVEPIFPE